MKKRPNGRYQRKAKLGEKYVFFYSSEPNSRAAERDIERQIRNYTEKEAAGKTFAEVADEWSTDHFPTLEHNTLKQYRPALKDVTDQFGTQYIKDITSM